MKKLLIIALILLLLVPSSLGEPNEHSRKPEVINIFLGLSDCNVKVINFTTTPPSIKCFNFDFEI